MKPIITPDTGNALNIDVPAQKLLDAALPGFAAECDPEEAEAMGAFAEEAFDWDEALAAAFDIDGEDTDHA